MHYELWNPQWVVHSLYRSSTRGPEEDSVESKHVAPLSHYMYNVTTVVCDGNSPLLFHKHFAMEHLNFALIVVRYNIDA
jgi:hypothetical protein